jgi:hypothetical protein
MSRPALRDLVAMYEERLLEGTDVLRQARRRLDRARVLCIEATALHAAAARIRLARRRPRLRCAD